MPFIGNKPSAVPLTSADIADGIITSAKIVDGTIVNADINASAAIVSTKLSGVGATAGQVIQVVTATDSTTRSTTSTSFVTASNTLSVSITPSSASNKIYVLVTASGGNTSGYDMYSTVLRDATNLGNSTKGLNYTSGGGVGYTVASVVCGVLDSPNTTSSVTYQFQFRANASTAQIQNDSSISSITVFEIKG